MKTDSVYNLEDKIAKAEDALNNGQTAQAAQIYHELGGLFYDKARTIKAVEYYRKALELQPHRPDFCANAARAMIASGDTQNGIELLRKAIEKMPENSQAHSNFLFYLHQQSVIDQKKVFDEHLRWAMLHAPMSRAKTKHNNDPDPARKLRIGYISPDFRNHSVAYFFEPLLDGHNRQAVELYGYSNVGVPDDVTERIKNKFNHFRNIKELNHRQAADLIEKDKIDILVDLAGHVGDVSLPILSYKPAPIQITYCGYPDTTGMKQIDYRFTDAIADLPQSQKFYTEKLVFLPEGFICYRPFEFAPETAEPPAINNGFTTFGSFNHLAKINPVIIGLWAQILKSVKNSHLILKVKGGQEKEIQDYCVGLFKPYAIEPERIEIFGWLPQLEHFKLYDRIDIALDTFPYNGTTTTCEALWMGVPVISLIGEHHISRVGLSILSRLGLDFFTAKTSQEYIDKAAALAAKPEALSQIRRTMRARIASSGLCYAKGFAQNVEQAYRQMWQKWCQENKKETKPIRIIEIGSKIKTQHSTLQIKNSKL